MECRVGRDIQGYSQALEVELDLERIKAARPKIAELLRDPTSVSPVDAPRGYVEVLFLLSTLLGVYALLAALLAVTQLISLLAARGTLGQFVFGFAVVDTAGTPASRARLFARWLVAWIPVLFIIAFVFGGRLRGRRLRGRRHPRPRLHCSDRAHHLVPRAYAHHLVRRAGGRHCASHPRPARPIDRLLARATLRPPQETLGISPWRVHRRPKTARCFTNCALVTCDGCQHTPSCRDYGLSRSLAHRAGCDRPTPSSRSSRPTDGLLARAAVRQDRKVCRRVIFFCNRRPQFRQVNGETAVFCVRLVSWLPATAIAS